MKEMVLHLMHRQAMIRKVRLLKSLSKKESKSVISQLRILIHLLLTLTLMLMSLKSSMSKLMRQTLALLMICRHLTESALKLICLRKQMQLKLCC